MKKGGNSKGTGGNGGGQFKGKANNVNVANNAFSSNNTPYAMNP